MRISLFVFLCFLSYDRASAGDKYDYKNFEIRPYIPLRQQQEQQHAELQQQIQQRIDEMQQKHRGQDIVKQRKKLQELEREIIPARQLKYEKLREEQIEEIQKREYMDIAKAHSVCIKISNKPRQKVLWKCRNLNPKFQEIHFFTLQDAKTFCIQGGNDACLCSCEVLEKHCQMNNKCLAFMPPGLESAINERDKLMGRLNPDQQFNQEDLLHNRYLKYYYNSATNNDAGPSSSRGSHHN